MLLDSIVLGWRKPQYRNHYSVGVGVGVSTGVGVGVGLGLRVGVGASGGLGQRPISVIKHGLSIVSGRPGPRPTLTQKHVHLS